MSRKFGLPGKVFLLGPVLETADVLDARTLAILQKAELVLHDEFIPREMLREVPKSSMVLDVSRMSQERIVERMIAATDEGKMVARLKAGVNSPSAALEAEVHALREAGIDFEVAPGLTAVAAA
jgi:precorrin-4 methylase